MLYRKNSESGVSPSIYRNIESDLATESYVANEQSVGVRRVLAGLRAGCLYHWACRLASTLGHLTAN